MSATSVVSEPCTQLLGRREECAVLDRVLDAAQAGRGSTLVVRGEAGVGKSSLLEYMAERADGCRLARAVGVESEVELPLAGVQQLLGASMLERSERLPKPQRNAIRLAFGLLEGPVAEPFLVAVAVLGLMSEIAQEQPLVALVDNAQWLDQASTGVLSFVARRLAAERIAMVFAVREPSAPRELEGFPELVVGGLDDHDARALLASAIPGTLDEQVRDRIVAETRGNPLALLELPRALTPAELAGGFGLPRARGRVGRIEEASLQRIASLPPEARQLLFLAAADPAGDVTLLRRAADELGLGTDAIVPAEIAGLVELGRRVRFRHPLMRWVAYGAACPAERRRAHAALASATDPESEPDRSAWHRAHAAAAPDEGVARELERSSSRAQERGGVAAAAAFLERAAELTPDAARRGQRALAAAQAKFDAGAPEAAEDLVATVALFPLTELDRALLHRLRARIAFVRTHGSDTPLRLSAAARRLEPLDPEQARDTHLEALWAAMRCGRSTNMDCVLAAAQAAMVSAPDHLTRASDLLLDGLIKRLNQGCAHAVPSLAGALEAFVDGGVSHQNIASCCMACELAMDLWDFEACGEIAGALTTRARERGALGVLPYALNYSATHRLLVGKFDAAEQLIADADAIATATRRVPITESSVLLAAWRGDRERTYDLRASAIAQAAERGDGSAVEVAEWAAATLHVGLGEYPEAVAAAQRVENREGLRFTVWILTELIEAAVRSGDFPTAKVALERLIERSALTVTASARGMQARSRALLSDGEQAENLYLDAIEQLEAAGLAVHHARAQLIYGEWLRREDRRVDARAQLRVAYNAFESMGAEAFAKRARVELLATGETVRRRSADTLDRLTPQEEEIARLATELSNAEIATRLFLSSRTVEWHLSKVFTKLGIRSRRELAHTLPMPDSERVAA